MLRHRLTPAEQRLSKLLWDWGFNHKRRQFVIGPYIADFCLTASRIVIEVDGPYHAQQVDYDARRTAFIEQAGYKVVRFSNEAVLTQPEAVYEGLVQALGF